MEDQKRIKPLSLMTIIDRLCTESTRRDLFRMLRFKETRQLLLEQLRFRGNEVPSESSNPTWLPPLLSLGLQESQCEPEGDEPAPLRRRRLKREQRYKRRCERRTLRLQELQALRGKLSSHVIERLQEQTLPCQIRRMMRDAVGRKLLSKMVTDRENWILLFDLWKFRLQQLRPKVTLLLLALSLMPLIISGLVSVQRASDRGKHAEHERQRQAAEFAAGVVHKTIEDVRRDVITIGRRFPIEHTDIDVLSASVEASGHLITQVLTRDGRAWHEGDALLDAKSYYNSVFLTDARGEIFYFYPYRPLSRRVKFEDADILQRSQSDLVFFSHLDLQDDRDALFVAVPLRTFDHPEKVEGYFGAMISPSNFDAALRSTLEIAAPGEGSGLLLLNPRKEVVAHCGFAQNESALPQEITDLSAGEQLTQGVTEFIRDDEDPLLIARAPVGDTGFEVAMVTPMAAAYYEVHALIWMLCIAVMACLVILVLIAAPVADTVVKPIQDLEQAIRQIRDNNYRDQLSINTVDELGRLAENFNAMVESLNRRDQSSAEAAQNLQASMMVSKEISERLRVENESFQVLAQGLGVGMRGKLHHIASYCQFAADVVGQVSDEDGQDLLSMIEDKTGELGQLGDDVLDYIEYRRTPVQLKEVNLSAMLQSVRQRILSRRRDAERHAIERGTTPLPVGEIEIPDDLPNIVTDERKLELVFEKLIDNGLKFNRSACPKVTITFEDDFDYIFTVKDNGIGIAPEERKNIFSLFTRLDYDFPGNGISLNLALSLVQMLKGELYVESNKEGGSAFCVLLYESA